MNENLLGTKKGKILVFLLSGPKMMTELKSVISSYDVLRYNILELQSSGYITKTESRDNNRKYVVSLTEKGREVAQNLKNAEEVSEGRIRINGDDEINIQLSTEEIEKSKNLRFLFHVNVLDDHITVEEVVPGKNPRIFNIYIKQNGGGNFRLWCEQDNSYDCWHVRAAWGYPQVQAMMMRYKGKTKICPVCHFENPENAKFCMNCGAKLE
ncbi:MAG: zinc-ribbon domain-containing protein [Ferroplasma sp.]|uniref:zinc-ribbon domain-containing protein n=1 Tax=Ferroplasma sp. TaxID=2591003 RepID=UPI0028162B54|nr:zinc-ribbon domain-containing protein [Ferroplasma sp.]WMT51836.1 MAG: zinc-ribbon domain-containing protein [Ferroplasma sp.]